MFTSHFPKSLKLSPKKMYILSTSQHFLCTICFCQVPKHTSRSIIFVSIELNSLPENETLKHSKKNTYVIPPQNYIAAAKVKLDRIVVQPGINQRANNFSHKSNYREYAIASSLAVYQPRAKGRRYD